MSRLTVPEIQRIVVLRPLLEHLKNIMSSKDYERFIAKDKALYFDPNLSDQEAVMLLTVFIHQYENSPQCCAVQKRGGEVFFNPNINMHRQSFGGQRTSKYALGGMNIQPYPQPYRKAEYEMNYEIQPSPYNRPVKTAGVGEWLESGATYLFGNATERLKRFMKEHGEEAIESISIGRVPLAKAIATAMSALTLGKFDKAKSNKGYDDFFHLFYIINDRFRLEKNQNVNLIDNYKPVENEEQFKVGLGGLKGKTINEFIKNGEAVMGEKDYWGNYDGLVKNCQNWVLQNMKANGIYSEALKDFTFQDTQELIDEVNPYVKQGMKEVTSVASALDKFVSWLSGGRYGLKRGGFAR